MSDNSADTPADKPKTALAVRREFSLVESDIPLFDSARFEHMARIASSLASSTLVPDTFRLEKRGNEIIELPREAVAANCLVAVNQAMKWRADPIAVMMAMSMVHGKPMYEGKLIHAVVEGLLGFKLKRKYFGTPGTDSYGIEIWTEHDADRGYETIKGTVGEWKTKDRGGKDNHIWTGENRQKLQLNYMGGRVWCRMNEPGIIVGVYAAEEMHEVLDMTAQPAPAPLITAGFIQPTIQPADGATVVDHQPATLRSVEGLVSNAGEKAPKRAEGRDYNEASLEVLNRAIAAAGRPIAAKEIIHDDGQILRIEIFGTLRGSPGQTHKFAPSGEFHSEIAEGELKVSHAAPDSDTPEDDDLEPERQASTYADYIGPSSSWSQLRALYLDFQKTLDWQGMDNAQRVQVRRETWFKAYALNVAAVGAGEPLEADPRLDAIAYRCALDATDDPQVIRDLWADFTADGSEAWKGLNEKQRGTLTSVTSQRLDLLEGAQA